MMRMILRVFPSSLLSLWWLLGTVTKAHHLSSWVTPKDTVSSLLSSSSSSYYDYSFGRHRRRHSVMAFAGGFAKSRRVNHKDKDNNNTNKRNKKPKRLVDVMPETLSSSSSTTTSSSSSSTSLDKWGLPPPTEEELFPRLPDGTHVLPATKHNYTLSEIQQALSEYVSLPALTHIFDEHSCLEKQSSSPPTTTDTKNDRRRLPMHLQLVHVSPPVLVIDHFCTPDECRELVNIAMPVSPQKDPPKHTKQDTNSNNNNNVNTQSVRENRFGPPVQVNSKTFSPLATSKRTSTSWFCHYGSVPVLLAKARYVLGLSMDHMEEPQIVRYQPGQEFTWHYDQVPPSQLPNGGQRVATLLVYCNSIPEGNGGGTIFRDLTMNTTTTTTTTNTKNTKNDATTTTTTTSDTNESQPLTVQPIQGRALLFFPAFANGHPDDRTLHRGQPSSTDEKRIVQLWIHQHAYQASVPPNNSQQAALPTVQQVAQELGYL